MEHRFISTSVKYEQKSVKSDDWKERKQSPSGFLKAKNPKNQPIFTIYCKY